MYTWILPGPRRMQRRCAWACPRQYQPFQAPLTETLKHRCPCQALATLCLNAFHAPIDAIFRIQLFSSSDFCWSPTRNSKKGKAPSFERVAHDL